MPEQANTEFWRDLKPIPDATFGADFMQSCNTGFIAQSDRLQDDTLTKVASDVFGVGQNPGLGDVAAPLDLWRKEIAGDEKPRLRVLAAVNEAAPERNDLDLVGGAPAQVRGGRGVDSRPALQEDIAAELGAADLLTASN